MKYLSNYFLLNINQRIKKMANKILWKLHQMCLFFFFFNNRINKQISERNMYKLKNDSNSISSTISITNELFNQNLRGWRKKKNRIFIRKKKEYFWGFKKIPDSKYQRHDVKFKYGYVSREERTFATSNVPRW